MDDRRQSIIDRIQARTDEVHRGFYLNGVAHACYEWIGPTSGEGRGGGYGRMSLDGQTVAVHLVAFTHYYGFIPGKKQVDHLCNNRLCWRKEHLELVSHLTNQRRRDQRQILSKPFFTFSLERYSQ